MTDFEWPWEYNFPPFFTLQPHAKTREQQISVWSDLILKYQKHKNEAALNIHEDTPLFHNNGINRKLPIEVRQIILEELQKTGHANALDKRKIQWEVYWHTLDEWAKLIYDWAVETGQTNTVCTLFEIANGDNSAEQEFYQLDQEVLLKSLKVLQEKGRCELMMFDDSHGVKFF